MKISKEIISIMEFVPKAVTELVEEIRTQTLASEEDIYDIRLILEEAITNAVVHGNECDTSLKVTTIVELNDGNLTMTISDDGKGFDPAEVANPIKNEDELFKSSGRGIFLMKKLAEKVDFSNNGATVKIVKKMKA